MNDVTRILNQLPVDGDALLAAIYGELRQMAARKLAHERQGHTLQTTDLVHEAYLRLAGPEPPRWENRQHFFGAASEAMRRILVEGARHRARLKRGGPDARKVNLDDLEIAGPVEDERILQVHDALDRLAAEDPAMAEIVKLRFFAGLTQPEIADLLGVSESTIRRQWAVAKVWLYQAIRDETR